MNEEKTVKQYVMHREGVNDCAISEYGNGYLCLTASYDHHSYLLYYDRSTPDSKEEFEINEKWDFYFGGDVNAVTFSEDGNMMGFAVSNKKESSFIVLPTPQGIIEWLRKNQLNNQPAVSESMQEKQLQEETIPV